MTAEVEPPEVDDEASVEDPAVTAALRVMNAPYGEGGLACSPRVTAEMLTPQLVRGVLVVARRSRANCLVASGWLETAASLAMEELVSALLCVLAGFEGASGDGWWQLRDEGDGSG